ncbi:hypothetical protein GCM10007103_28920 [Salinimicrobium marinum]|uniref:Capsule assembly protein Wzi n=2 Tax=Salinimicrobium marinum TaxID=680283 RepID=A0A918SKE7_9FLAO|nr:hypothetical protein GCM10007103_28920 [Salinimicrobium marinum]
MFHNQRGRISEDTRLATWVSGKATYNFQNNSRLEIGAGILLRDGIGKKFITDELFASYSTSFFQVTAGRRQLPKLYNGLSASNQSLLWSLNARPLPGVLLKTTRPIFLQKNFGFEASWGEYFFEKERFTSNARLHHKSFHLVYSSSDRSFKIKAGLQHFAQWGGKSIELGQQPEAFEDYLRIVAGSSGNDGATGSDQNNALGNHLGGYELYFSKNFSNFYAELFYNHIFEDGSGRRLGNTPDGRYGLFISLKEPISIFQSFMYEFYSTHHQSHTTSGVYKNDNYFNNTGYRSGWTYYNRVIGAPFFTVDVKEKLHIINNKFTAHHIGIGGNLLFFNSSHPYRALLSYAQNDGRRDQRYHPKQDVFSVLYDINLLQLEQKKIDVSFQIGMEYNTYSSPIYGAGLNAVYKM